MNKSISFTLGVALLVTGSLLLFVHADRQFASLPPTPGLPHVITLKNTMAYQQEFTVRQQNISRLGLYIKPLTTKQLSGVVTVQLLRGSTRIFEQQIPAVFAHPDSALDVRISPSIATVTGERLRVAVAISDDLSGKVGLQTRQQDESFNRDAVFFIDGKPQDDPLAYEAYYSQYPALTLQLGSLLILAALWLLFGLSLSTSVGQIAYASGIVIAANVPAFASAAAVYPLMCLQVVIVFGVLRSLRKTSLPLPAQLLAAHTLAFTSWWPLVFIAARPAFSVSIASLKDIFFDPHQLGLTTTGAYIGIPTLVAAGFSTLILFLGKDDRLVNTVALAITYLALIDVWSVYASIIS